MGLVLLARCTTGGTDMLAALIQKKLATILWCRSCR
ncbi:MAG: hypothetical protein V8R80_01840 [Eubacterium sp.]